MARYSPKRKESILKKLLPPLNMTVSEVARSEGISSKASIIGVMYLEEKVNPCQVKH